MPAPSRLALSTPLLMQCSTRRNLKYFSIAHAAFLHTASLRSCASCEGTGFEDVVFAPCVAGGCLALGGGFDCVVFAAGGGCKSPPFAGALFAAAGGCESPPFAGAPFEAPFAAAPCAGAGAALAAAFAGAGAAFAGTAFAAFGGDEGMARASTVQMRCEST